MCGKSFKVCGSGRCVVAGYQGISHTWPRSRLSLLLKGIRTRWRRDVCLFNFVECLSSSLRYFIAVLLTLFALSLSPYLSLIVVVGLKSMRVEVNVGREIV